MNFGGGDTTILAVIFLGTLVTVVLVFYGIRMVTAGAQQRMKQRVNRVKGGGGSAAAKQAAVSLKISQEYSSIQSFDKILKKFLPHPDKLRKRLRMTGKKISIGNYVLMCLVFGVVTAFAVKKFAGMPMPVAGLSGVVIGMLVPHFIIGYLVNRRLTKFVRLFPEAIDLIVRGLKSGLPSTESMKVVGAELPDPVGEEFRRVADALKFGKTLDQALWSTAERIDTPEFNFFVISLAIQQETGGNLTETLQNLSEILRKRRQMKLKIKALSSEAKASAYIIGALPFVMFFIILALNPDYMMTLFRDPRGIMMTIGGGIWMGIGFFVMYKMVRFEI